MCGKSELKEDSRKEEGMLDMENKQLILVEQQVGKLQGRKKQQKSEKFVMNEGEYEWDDMTEGMKL